MMTKTAKTVETIKPKRARGRAALVAILCIIALAAGLRIYGLSWGLPDVFEEATPLTVAWKMWGWGPADKLDLNPRFFSYPSLSIYCQFLGQGAMYLVMRLAGVVDSSVDYAGLYVADKTPFLILGRTITLLFGVATIWLLYRTCRRLASAPAACAAAFILAVCAFHIEKSQAVEVDVPLAFLSLLALYFLLRVAEEPSRRHYLLAGAAIGLAASMKYTAAILFIPLAAAHLLAARGRRERSGSGKARKPAAGRWILLAAAVGLAAAAFIATSPYVLLDARTAIKHLSIERLHMKEGHFGLEASGTGLFYLEALSSRIFGWPILALAAGGLIHRLFRRRDPAAIVLAAFLVPYLVGIGSWAMKADRYLMPALPIIAIFAAAAMDDIARLPWAARARVRRIGIAAALIVVSAAPLALAYPRHMKTYAPDTRTLAREWIESNVSSGAFIVSETYGPDLIGPHILFSLNPVTREAVLARLGDRPRYAVQPLPMLQVYPERSAGFYDPRLYRDADLFITSSSIQSRYRREPRRFAAQLAFYDSLDARCIRLAAFSVPDGSKPAITIYGIPGRRTPFAGRNDIRGPQQVRAATLSGVEALFYKNLGVNYESFKFYEQAIRAYDLALGYVALNPSWYIESALGRARCHMALGRKDEALRYLLAAAQSAPTPAIREHILRSRRSLQSGSM